MRTIQKMETNKTDNSLSAEANKMITTGRRDNTHCYRNRHLWRTQCHHTGILKKAKERNPPPQMTRRLDAAITIMQENPK